MTNIPFLRSLVAASLVGLAAGTPSLPVQAQQPGKVLLNLDKSGVAIRGYDPVAYFTQGKAVKGNPPQFGGYCGYGASRGYPADIDPNAFTIMEGRLILQNSMGVLRRWQEDPDSYLRKADGNWPAIVEKHGKPEA